MLGPKYLINGTIGYFVILSQGCYGTITETIKDPINQDNMGLPAFNYYNLLLVI